MLTQSETKRGVAPYLLLPSVQHVKRDHDPPSISWLLVCHGFPPGVRRASTAAVGRAERLRYVAYARKIADVHVSPRYRTRYSPSPVEQRTRARGPRRSYAYTVANEVRVRSCGGRNRVSAQTREKRRKRKRIGEDERTEEEEEEEGGRRRRARIQRRRDLTGSLNGINYYTSSSP